MSEIQAAVTSKSSAPDAPQKRVIAPVDVPGYEFVSKLGTGGYGDVWKAIGPGGFAKAVKVLFGQFDGMHAETELKALNRLRDVRHPFLLSIERVEVIDGRVVIVTELADCSMELRFRQAREEGLPGIPREELLGFLRDAADALDFMSNQHSLQHLDIKPDNLFIQGQHVKVGDFGLAKNIAATAASMVDGFTPLYAPPELFEGRPSATSDQYSLAIVYQMMLTGQPPHNGRTAAQLTAQHLRSTPDLSPLHRADRPIVARALSKNPATRFTGCRQFVDELMKRKLGSTSIRPSGESSGSPRPDNQTHVVDPASIGRSDSHLLKPAIPARPVDVTRQDTAPRPCLMIGVGGLGCEIVSALRRRLAPAIAMETLPTMEFLCLDSDNDALRFLQAESSALESGLPELRTLPVPLRTSIAYRKGASAYLNWLSRRWLFNIPRSGKVEGIRPLGRLAFVDHFGRFRDLVSDALHSCSAPVPVPDSEDQEIPAVDVLIVGSTSGGTSSGALLDVALAVRAAAKNIGLTRVTHTGVLLHGTSGAGRQSDVQDANTICFLNELNYYSSRECEPLRLHPDEQPAQHGAPFDDVCFVHLGDDLTAPTVSTETGKVTEYLYRWLATPARPWLEGWRRERQRNAVSGELLLRTLNSAAFESTTMKAASAASGELAVHVITRWTQPGSVSGRPGPDSPAGEWITSAGLSDIDALVNRLLKSELASHVEQLSTVVRRAAEQQAQSWRDVRLNDFLGRVFSDSNADAASPATTVRRLSEISERLLQERAGELLALAGTETVRVIDEQRLLGAGEAFLQYCRGGIADAAEKLESQQQAVRQALAGLVPSSADAPPLPLGKIGGLPELLEQYCGLVAYLAVAKSAGEALRALDSGLQQIHVDRVQPMRRTLQRSMQQIPTLGPRQQLPDSIVAAFDRYLADDKATVLSEMAAPGVDTERMAVDLRKAAMELLMDDFMKSQPSSDDEGSDSRTAFPLSASPLLRNVGGQRRVLALVPDGGDGDTWMERMRRAFGDCVSRCPTGEPRVEAICEVEGIAVHSAIESLSHLKSHMENLATQVHARNDISWV